MGNLLQDLKYGLRVLSKAPGYTAVVVVCLALGIGANTAIFTLINAVLLKSLPVEKPRELVLLGAARSAGMAVIDGIPQPGPWELISYPLYQKYHDDSTLFKSLCAFQSFEDRLTIRLNNGGAGAPAEQAYGKLVSGNYFSVLGVNAAVGRTLTPEDDTIEGAHPVAVISYGYWQRRFSRDSSVVGRTMDINGTPFTIVGVTAAGFFGETLERDPADVWIPLAMQPQIMMQPSIMKQRNIFWLHVMGRLKPTVSLEQAQAAVTLHLQQYLQQIAGTNLSADDRRDLAGVRIDLTPGGKGVSQLRRRYSEPLQVLMALVGLVLLIACANIANLQLARATSRQKEISLRCALGASRTRMIRQLLTESLLLAALGGAAGLVLAAWGTSLLVSLVSHGNYIPLSTGIDGRVLIFTLLVSLLTGILFGLAPAVRSARIDLSTSLKEGARNLLGNGSHFSLTKILVVLQVAICLITLVAGGLLIRTLQKLESQDLGFERENVLMIEIDPRLAGYKSAQLPGFYHELLDRVKAVPGVKSASVSLYALLSGMERNESISVLGYTPRPREQMAAQLNFVGPNYFETVGMSLLAGRGIGPQDTGASAKVAVINQALAHRYFGNHNPIGKHFGVGDIKHAADFEVVGLVKDANYNDLRDRSTQMFFIPVMQNPEFLHDLEIRTLGSPTAVAADVRRALDALNSKMPVRKVTTLRQQVDASLNQERLIAQLSSGFGGLALLLACVGLYGVMAYAVTRRTNEIGIRMALGAGTANVLWMVLRETLVLVVAGLGIGIPAALACSRLISSELFGLSPYDPLTTLFAALVLVTVSSFAGYLPARRAAQVDPMVALRYE